MKRLLELMPFVKEALHKTAQVANTFRLIRTNAHLFYAVRMVGHSMLPTLKPGNVVLAERITSRSGKVRSGDLVIIRTLREPRGLITKRVKGVEGDVVSYMVDSNLSDEQKTVVVPKGHVWVEGDNIHHSADSRKFGPVPCAFVESRIVAVVSNSIRTFFLAFSALFILPQFASQFSRRLLFSGFCKLLHFNHR